MNIFFRDKTLCNWQPDNSAPCFTPFSSNEALSRRQRVRTEEKPSSLKSEIQRLALLYILSHEYKMIFSQHEPMIGQQTHLRAPWTYWLTPLRAIWIGTTPFSMRNGLIAGKLLASKHELLLYLYCIFRSGSTQSSISGNPAQLFVRKLLIYTKISSISCQILFLCHNENKESMTIQYTIDTFPIIQCTP